MELKKAKNQQQKLQRATSILNAAETLFLQQTSELPSAIEIANETGIAKGSLYNYFRTKEAIFLALLERHIQTWIEDIERDMRQYESVTVEDVCHYLTAYWIQNPIIGQLMRISDAMLEPRVDSKVLANYQTRVLNDFKRLTLAFKELNPDVESGEWQKVLLRSIKLQTLAWTMANPAAKANGAYDNQEFSQICSELLKPFWQHLFEFKKEQPKEKTGWRKLLG